MARRKKSQGGISPGFKLYLIKEFQRLKEDENNRLKLEWNLQRTLSKINYRIHTDAIKEILIPKELSKVQINFVYANEADLLNVALFGITAKQWREANPKEDGNIGDKYYSIMENDILIRPLSNAYSKQVVDLILPIQQLEFNVPVTLQDQPDLLDIEKAYFTNGGHLWGGFIGGRLVGTIAIISIGHHSGAVRKMFVKKEFRGKELKIAQKLFETMVTYCKANHINDLYLGTVNMLKAAHRFYERNGFLLIEKELLPTYFPRMAADDVYYYLHLNNA